MQMHVDIKEDSEQWSDDNHHYQSDRAYVC